MRIAFIGNCQVQTYCLLATAMFDDADVRTLDYSQADSRDDEARQAFVASVENFDLIFAQTAVFSHTGERDLRQRFPGKVLTIANFYFRGIFPDSCYIGGFSDRLVEPSSVHSLIVLDAFLRRLSAEQAARQFTIENFERLGILGAWSASMEELRRREAHGAIDVPGADLVEDACRRYPAFLTMNHPSLAFLSEYFYRMCGHAGLPFRYANPSTLQDPLAHHDTTPVHDEFAAHMGLAYRTSQRWKINRLGARYMSREEYVEACYAVYENSDVSRLYVNSPTDMVHKLRGDADLRYLVGEAAHGPLPAAADREDREEIQSNRIESLAAISSRLREIADVGHRIKSYLEVMDPKMEAIFHEMSKPPEPLPPGLCDRVASAIIRWRLALIGVAAVSLGLVACLAILLGGGVMRR